MKVYLQFDGLDAATHVALRGRDLRHVNAQALDRCADAGVPVILVAAVESGVNSHELGVIVRHAIDHPAVRGVVFQPVTHAGRHAPFDPMLRLTNSDVIHALVVQCPDWFRPSDFFPVPCCAPTCRSITYVLADTIDVIDPSQHASEGAPASERSEAACVGPGISPPCSACHWQRSGTSPSSLASMRYAY